MTLLLIYKKKIIDFRFIEYPHIGQNIYVSIMFILKEYYIKNNIFSITFDNVSNNTSAIEFFKSQIKNSMGGLLYHVRSVCHIMNLIVQDGLKFFEQHIHKIRCSIIYIRFSSMRYK